MDRIAAITAEIEQNQALLAETTSAYSRRVIKDNLYNLGRILSRAVTEEAAPVEPARDEVTADAVREMLATDQLMLERAIVRIWQAQTPREQEVEATIQRNGVGFSVADARRMSRLVRCIAISRRKPWGSKLYPRQVALAREVMPKYAGQLVEIAHARHTAQGAN